MPSFASSLQNLRILDVIGNQISGELPADIGQLSRLTILNVADNLPMGKTETGLLAR
ncbi:hypothetical protein U1Q18_045314, partial [Sarracenia purpurea var. burkii]